MFAHLPHLIQTVLAFPTTTMIDLVTHIWTGPIFDAASNLSEWAFGGLAQVNGTVFCDMTSTVSGYIDPTQCQGVSHGAIFSLPLTTNLI